MAQTSKNGSGAEPSIADLEDQIATLRKDIAGLTGTIAALGRNQGARWSAAAEESAETMRAKAADAAEMARVRAESLYADTEAHVRQNPAAALGIAAGLGFLFGLMTSRR